MIIQIQGNRAATPGKIKKGGGGGLSSSQVFKPQKALKRSIINASPCIALFASNLILRQLKLSNFNFSPEGHYFLSYFLNIGTSLRAITYS